MHQSAGACTHNQSMKVAQEKKPAIICKMANARKDLSRKYEATYKCKRCSLLFYHSLRSFRHILKPFNLCSHLHLNLQEIVFCVKCTDAVSSSATRSFSYLEVCSSSPMNGRDETLWCPVFIAGTDPRGYFLHSLEGDQAADGVQQLLPCIKC